MKRRDLILAGALAVQLVLIAVLFWPRTTAAGPAGSSLLAALTADDVTQLVLEDASGNRVVLQQTAGQWVLPEAGDFPAQGDKITALLEKLVAVKTDRLVTRTDASHKRLQVATDDFVGRVEIKSAGGSLSTMYVGSSPNYASVHVRLHGKNETYLTSDLASWDVNATPSSWIDTSYLKLDQAEVTAIQVSNDQGELNLTKDDQGNWSMAGLSEDELLDTAVVSQLANRATSVTMLGPIGRQSQPEFGLEAPRAVITIQTNEKAITLLIGSKFTQDNSYVVKSSESPYYVRVNEYGVKDLLEKGRQDLIQIAPTPTP